MKIEKFFGTAGKYKAWRKDIEAQKELYQFTDPELALLMFLSTGGECKDHLETMTVPEMTAQGGLQDMLQLLDEAYGKTADEKFEEADAS